MISQPLFFAPTTIEKVAGYKLPANPKFWQSEIIRYLKSQHPYLPLEESEIDIRKLDATAGAAVGSVILSNEIAIPIIISRPRPGTDPELSPMDVFFHKGRYQYLDPEAIKQLTHKPQIGEPEGGKDSRAVGGNPYVGDMTGDATPLEYSGQASPFAGPYDGTKVSMDLSHELIPERLLKEAGKDLKEKMKEKATTFGITGAVGGAVRGGIMGKGGAKGKLKQALHDAAVGGVAGAAGGASLPVARRALGHDKQEKKELRKEVRKELKKMSSANFSSGVDALVENGILARMCKHAFLDPNDVANFRQILASNPHVLQGSANNLRLVEVVATRGPSTTAATGAIVKQPNMMQIYRKADGSVCIKFSGGPETKTTPAELKDMLGDRLNEVMSKLRSGSVYMQHDGIQQASWDAKRPMSEAKVINRDGLYAVRLADGSSVVGMVVKAVMDFDGRTLPMQMLVTPEGKYAIAGEMYGARLADKHRIPSQVPAAGQTGVFVNYVHGTPISTLPMRVTGVRRVKPDDGDDRVVYLISNPVTGERMAVCPVPGVQGFERMNIVDPGVKALAGGDQVYYMPGDSEWVVLRESIRVAESESALSKVATVEDVTHVYFGAGLWHVSDKTASWNDLDEPHVREVLVGMGMTQDEAESVMDKTRERQGIESGVKVAGLHEAQIQGFEVSYPQPRVYDDETVAFTASCRPGLEIIKAAAESGHPETLDSILSLEFITPQNTRYFVDNIEDFDEAASRLAALLIGVRLGMPHVPEQPVKDALEGLARTLNKLRILKSAMDHKNERASSTGP
jgi:hypothetical protein